jgi:hypothetical protein
VLNYRRLEWLARDKHSSLLGPFISYKENELLPIQPQVAKALIYIKILAIFQNNTKN